MIQGKRIEKVKQKEGGKKNKKKKIEKK